MTLSNGALTVFYWFLDLTSAGTLVSWIVICLNNIRLHSALKAQGIDGHELPWYHSWTKYTSWFALCACSLFLLTGGFSVFINGNWDVGTFISSYLDIPLVLFAYGLWKVFKKTSILKLQDIPIRAALEEIRMNPEEKIPEPRGWKRLNVLWG